MALGLRSWVALFAGAGALVALWLLPPESASRRRAASGATPESAEARRLERELARANNVLARRRWLDSLTAEVDRAAAAGLPAALGLPEAVSDDDRAALSRALAEEIRRLGVSQAQVRLGVFMVDATAGSHPHLIDYPQMALAQGTEYYLIGDGSDAYCLVVEPLSRRLDLHLEALQRTDRGPTGGTSMLGPCAYHAIYGSPGDGIDAWLRAGAYGLAEIRAPDPDSLPLAGLARRGVLGIRGYLPVYGAEDGEVLGLRGIPARSLILSPLLEGCLAGRRSACGRAASVSRRALRGARQTGADPELPRVHVRSPFGILGSLSNFLADLEQEFGREAFAQFWTSPLDLDEAFAGAFGVPIEEWVYGWAIARFGREPLGPTLGFRAVWLSLLTLGALAALSVHMARRRT